MDKNIPELASCRGVCAYHNTHTWAVGVRVCAGAVLPGTAYCKMPSLLLLCDAANVAKKQGLT